MQRLRRAGPMALSGERGSNLVYRIAYDAWFEGAVRLSACALCVAAEGPHDTPILRCTPERECGVSAYRRVSLVDRHIIGYFPFGIGVYRRISLSPARSGPEARYTDTPVHSSGL